MNDPAQLNKCELRLFNVLGEEVMNTQVTGQMTAIETSNLPSGIYFYKVMSNSKVLQSGKLIAQ
jgi:hypothetical protein